MVPNLLQEQCQKGAEPNFLLENYSNLQFELWAQILKWLFSFRVYLTHAQLSKECKYPKHNAL